MAPTCNTTNMNITGCSRPEFPGSLSLESLDIVPNAEDVGRVISDGALIYILLILYVGLFIGASLLGTASNIINIIVYWKQGIKDSITVGLFALSVSDFFVVFFPLFTAGCYIADYLHPNSAINFKAVAGNVANQPRNMFFTVSGMLTAFLSIERCLCVTKPIKVKIIFTRSRTTVISIIIFLICILGWVPKFYAQPLRWQERSQSQNKNETSEVFKIWYHPYFDDIEAFHNSVMTILFPTTAQVVVIFTAIIMVNALHKASRFRQIATQRKNQKSLDNAESLCHGIEFQGTSEKGDHHVLDSRDSRLVKTMVILVTIMTVSNVPYIGLEYAQLFVPDLRPGKRYENLFRIIYGTNIFLGTVNASVNSIVYYKIGSKYRKIVNDMFCRGKWKN